MAIAPNESNCASTWQAYGTEALPSDSSFAVSNFTKINVTGDEGLDNVRTIIASGVPLAYGTSLYTDFPPYNGTPTPYVGNGIILINKKTDKPAGHCMMIIGYDDTQQAVLIQNSFGPNWGGQWNGNGGFIWMAYNTFQVLAQGIAFYITSA